MHGNGADLRETSGARAAAAALALLALSVPLFFLGLGHPALSEPDEPYYAVPAREMLRSGDWSMTTLGGEPWFDKPILFYWVVAAAYRLFGVSEGSARLGSALAGLAGVLAVYLLGRRGRLGERGAFLSAVVLATMLEYALLARAAITDATLALLVTAGMLSAERYLATGRVALFAGAGAAFGLAVLTKGPVGVLAPGLALAAHALVARRADAVRPAALGAAAAGFLATVAPWFGWMLAARPDLVVRTFLGEGNLRRFLEPEHLAFPLFYVVVLAVGALPWTGALPAALLRAVRPEALRAERGAGREPGPVFLLCWFGAVLLLFSLSASKLLSYLLPALPPAAMLVGGYWSETPAAPRGSGPPRHARGSALLGCAIAIAASAALVAGASRGRWEPARPIAVWIALALVAGAVLAALALRRGAVRLAAVHVVTSAAIVLLFVFGALPAVEGLDSDRPFARELERKGIAPRVAGAFRDVRRYGVDFYLGRTLPRVEDPSEVARRVAADPGSVWIAPSRRAAEIVASPAWEAEIVASSRHLVGLRLRPAGSPPGDQP